MAGPFFDAHPLPMWIEEDATRRLRDVNASALRLYGYRREQFLAMTASALEAQSHGEVELQGAAAIRRHRTAQGTAIAVRLEKIGFESGDGRLFLVTAVDVTREVEIERALRRREQHLRQLFETASEWYWETDAEGRFRFVSQNFEAMYGIPVAGMLGKRITEHAASKVDPNTATRALEAIRARQPARDLIYSHQLADGRVVRAMTSAVPLFDDTGAFSGYCGVCKDITAQIEAETALRDSEQRFRQLFEIAADYYFEQDEQYRYSYVSPGYEAIFGTSLAAVKGKRLSDLPDVSIDPRMGKMAILAHKAKQPYRDFVYSRRAMDGRTRWFKVSATPIFDADGKFRGYRGVGAEITPQVEAEQAGRLAQQRFDEAVALITQPFVLYDAEGRATAFNQAFTDLHSRDGYTPVCRGASYRSIAQWQVETRFHAARPGEPPVTLETLLEHYASDAEHSYALRDGRWMMVAYRSLPGGGRVGLWTEVTAIRRAKEEAEAASRAKSEFLARMSHELRTPLNAVIGYSEMLYEDAVTEGRSEQVADLGRIAAAGRHLLTLVNGVLDLSKIEAGKMELALAHFDFERFLDEVASTAQPLMRDNGNDFVVERGAGPRMVIGDAVKLRQVALNLLSNAAKFTHAGRVTLVARRERRADGEWIELDVRDTGIGVSRENLPKLFQNFSQIEAFSSSRHGGSGLGLALSRKLCQLMGGDIGVESEPGRGSCFTVRVPARWPADGAAG
jgi:PAS domain S-box-containing protein